MLIFEKSSNFIEFFFRISKNFCGFLKTRRKK